MPNDLRREMCLRAELRTGAASLRGIDLDPTDPGSLIVLDHYERLPLILEWYASGALDPDDLNQLLAMWWTCDENPYALGWEACDWVELFESAGFVTDTPGVAVAHGPLTVWRGGAPGAQRGLSWTTDRAVGEWFAQRTALVAGAGELWRATVDQVSVLGMFNDRQETEVLLDPHGLGDIITIATYAEERSEEVRSWA